MASSAPPVLGRSLELAPPGLAQPHRQAAAVVGVGRAVDQAGADHAVDRAADRGLAAAERGGDLLERRRLALGNRAQQLAPGALGPFGRAVGDIVMDDRREARRERGWR